MFPSWLDQFSGVTQSRLSRPISGHFPIVLEGGGIRRGPTPFRFENMCLKVEGFKDLVRTWWQGIEVRGSASYRLIAKMKEIKVESMEQRSFWEAGMQQIFNPATSRFLGLGGKREKLDCGGNRIKERSKRKL